MAHLRPYSHAFAYKPEPYHRHSLGGIQDTNNCVSVSTWADAINDAIREIEATRVRPCECYHCGARRWVASRCYYCETEREGTAPLPPNTCATCRCEYTESREANAFRDSTSILRRCRCEVKVYEMSAKATARARDTIEVTFAGDVPHVNAFVRIDAADPAFLALVTVARERATHAVLRTEVHDGYNSALLRVL